MPKCHKIYLNCIWHVLSEWHGLNFDSALLTKVYWNYTTHIVRVCRSHKYPIHPALPFTKKSNLQVHFGSKVMASLYDLLCYHSLTCTDPLLEELLAYLPTRFHSHIFDYIAYENSSDEESVHSVDSSVSEFYSDDSTYFCYIFYTLLCIFFMQLQILPQGQAQDGIKKAAGRERPGTCTCPWQVNQFPKSPRFWQGLLLAFSAQPPTTRPFDEKTAGAQKRFGYSSRLEPPAVRRVHSHRPLTKDVPPIYPRIRIGGTLQTGP